MGKEVIPSDIKRIIPRRELDKYIFSLKQFIETCNLKDELYLSRASITEEAIAKRINMLSEQEINFNRVIWNKAFKNTRFLELFKNKDRQS